MAAVDHELDTLIAGLPFWLWLIALPLVLWGGMTWLQRVLSEN